MKSQRVALLFVISALQSAACFAQTVEKIGAQAIPSVKDESLTAQSKFEGGKMDELQNVELQRQGLELQRMYHSPKPSKQAIEEQNNALKAQNHLLNVMRHQHKGPDVRLDMGRYDTP